MTRQSTPHRLLGWSLAALAAAPLCAQQAAAKAAPPTRPNILVVMTDDVGIWNVGAYSHGVMAPTPNLDRLAKEGMLFTDHYGQPTCTPGRAAFITGQLPIRTGLTTVGVPGSKVGLDGRDLTLAQVLKPLGYATAQFGKNHLGDRNEHLPTVHGFDEFYGNLYHLNSEEEPEDPDWPTDPEFNARWRPRGVLDCVATDVDDPTEDARFGKVGKQRIKDTGPLTRKRMETVDEEFLARTSDFMTRAVQAGKPFFVWHCPSRMHIYTHLKPESRYLAKPHTSGDDVYGSGMMELDGHVGQLLAKLDELGVAENTIVIFTADNGPMSSWWPDGGATPYRSEKATTWEGGIRVPFLLRWPARVPKGSVSNGIHEHLDCFTTLAAAAGATDVVERLRREHNLHVDGVDQLAHWTEGKPSARNVTYYYNESKLTALRFGNWKGHFHAREGFFDYDKPSAEIYNLRTDPFERHGGTRNNDQAMKKAFLGGQIRDILGAHMKTLADFPPRQAGGTLTPGR
ncbi:MAG: arylsulfatase [Planctomycetota bacterium]